MNINELATKSILSKSNLPISDYSVNPYVGCPHACRYCYASFMKRFTGHTEPWGEFVDVKYWTPIIDPHKYDGKDIFMCSVTDPYNPLEEKYGRTRAFLSELSGSTVSISIQTKSDLVLRDLDLIKKFKNIRIGFSINTLDESFKDDMDRAVSIERRIKAMEILHNEGIRTTCFISPIFPEITNVFEIIEAVKDKSNLVWLENLNLRGSYKASILNYIKETRPELSSLYDDIYTKGKRDYWSALDREVRAYCEKNNYEYLRDEDRMDKSITDPLTVVNFFYHEEITKSAKKALKAN